ncbi:DUF6817 domain-containing protein [Mycobacterium sp. 94-17]|uniref:DUF6817 domain-containing protein n=1 Tax=Mycobacterium sp. 94-17 TaxID=2986147 RepID=UPI002D1F3D42|nr:hypothetical protein [Mycobacterium sp. 94-17]MEB4208903.1 hypothetical protein [Mycobacterium sp. 94-17]
MNQAIACGMDAEALCRLKAAHDLAAQLTFGMHRSQGVPFLCHLTGTASIALGEDAPVDAVAAALLHAAYILHAFDGSDRRVRPAQRSLLAREVGAGAERLVWEYHHLPWGTARALDAHLAGLATAPPAARQLLLLRLANELEDHLDLAGAYANPARARERAAELGGRVVELARRLGHPLLAADLEDAYAGHAAASLPDVVMADRRLSAAGRRHWSRMGVTERWRMAGLRWAGRRPLAIRLAQWVERHRRTERVAAP